MSMIPDFRSTFRVPNSGHEMGWGKMVMGFRSFSLFRNCNGFCKVARLVDVEAPHDGQVIAQQLQRNDVDDSL